MAAAATVEQTCGVGQPTKKAQVEEHTKLDDARSNVSVTTFSPQHGQRSQMQVSRTKTCGPPLECKSRASNDLTQKQVLLASSQSDSVSDTAEAPTMGLRRRLFQESRITVKLREINLASNDTAKDHSSSQLSVDKGVTYPECQIAWALAPSRFGESVASRKKNCLSASCARSCHLG